MFTIEPKKLVIAAATAGALALAGCEPQDESSTPAYEAMLDMQIPASLTGGKVNGANTTGYVSAQATGVPCAFHGGDDDDPLRNGYEMTKFMVSAIATWTCIADLVIEIATFVPNDGAIHETDNDIDSPTYDDDDPTHFSITADSATQTTVRTYYGFHRDEPPTAESNPGLFISWHEEVNGDISGRIVIHASALDEENEPDDPTDMRMDFNFTETEEFADMFLRFDDGNEWGEGFRIEVTRDLTANPLTKVYTARGLIEMKRQFHEGTGITAVPDIRMYTVSNRIGDGAALARMEDVALPLVVDEATNNHLGNYLFTKQDKYFFDDDQSADEPWDFIEKFIETAVLDNGRTTDDTTVPSLADIELILGLPVDYLTTTCAVPITDNCTLLLNEVFKDGFADQEPNQGMDPMDWRSDAIENPDYLDSVYPNGENWNNAFDMVFNP